MSDQKTQLPDLSKTTFSIWKQKVLGYCQQLGFKKYLTTATAPAGTSPEGLEKFATDRSRTI
ncbi:uncharacterized protein PGTG_22049 [Puccinia graminis f. sp. tritici CRL 75-36-700-3]|uniref:Uncharacterized protein n=1 Tax=Puccinia graminis f. sp. tritici (strain CRL 75-36-700-3 / race SCCL) TaxID=418459 RepID=H6QTH7_PUCGT|nr:uncharacterized protein PGTG_22049 [Puccinia graminis f. sp. tritici CRL 75-36-700-3]EHS64192.1 hypothetical protein PGTG_22049 [Puccinia graminis f. sp. tritici CRL 75-36-700-3]